MLCFQKKGDTGAVFSKKKKKKKKKRIAYLPTLFFLAMSPEAYFYFYLALSIKQLLKSLNYQSAWPVVWGPFVTPILLLTKAILSRQKSLLLTKVTFVEQN